MKKEEEEGLLETLDKLIQQTEAGRVTANQTNDSNVYYLKNSSPRMSKSKSKSSKKRLKSKTKHANGNTTIASTTLKPEATSVTYNETQNEAQDVNQSLEKYSQNNTTTERPTSKEQQIDETITSVEKNTLTPVPLEIMSVTSRPETVSTRKLLDNGNLTFEVTTPKPELNQNETSINETLFKEEKHNVINNENLESDVQNETEGPPSSSNETLASDDISATQTTMEKLPMPDQVDQNNITFRKSLNLSEPMHKYNGEDLNEPHSATEIPQGDYSPRLFDARIENPLNDDNQNFIKLLSENANDFKRNLGEKDVPIENSDLGTDRDNNPELQPVVERLVKKVLVMKSINRNHFDSDEEKAFSNEYDTEPSDISYRRFPNTPVVESNSPYSYNPPASNTYYMKDRYVPVPVPVANTIINPVAPLPVANNLQMHYGANALWNNNLAEMSRVHKLAHINHLSRLINNLNLVGGVLYPPLFNNYVYF